MKWFKKLAVLSLTSVLATLSFVSSGAHAEETDRKAFHYVALGDSLTAGYEPGMNEKSIPYGFVNRLYEQALYSGTAEVNNYGIVGLTSEGLKNFVNAAKEGNKVKESDIQEKFPDRRINKMVDQMLAQIKDIHTDIETAELITITIGGNDFPHTKEELPVLTEATSKQIIDGFTANVEETISTLKEMNPECDIYIANNYLPVPKIASFMEPEMYEALTNLTTGMGESLEEIVKRSAQTDRHVFVVDTATAFIDKETMFTHVLKTDIHPTQDGYEAMAVAFAEKIWGQYKKPTITDPISVIFSGKELISNYEVLIISDRTYVTLTDYTQALGVKHDWDHKTHTTSIKFNGNSVSFKNNKSEAIVNGKTVPLTGPVMTKNVKNKVSGKIEPKMYIPLGSLATALGLDVIYISQSDTAYINIK